MNYRSKIFIFVFLIPLLCLSQKKSQHEVFLEETFGFIKAQEFLLNTIERKYPELGVEASIAKLEFRKNYSRALSQINVKMKEFHGNSFANYLLKLENIATANFENMSRKDAVLFINQVKKRAQGTIKSPYLETLLKYQYMDNPVGELLDNHYNIYSITNYSNNSSKTKISVRVPKSWKELNFKQSPLILKKFRSEQGMGQEIITIMKSPLNGYGKNLNSFTAEELQKMIPENAKQTSINKKLINDKLTGIIAYEETNNAANSNLKRYVFLYTFKHQKQLFIIDCSIYRSISDNANYKIFQPLLQSIVASIKIDTKPFTKNTISENHKYN